MKTTTQRSKIVLLALGAAAMLTSLTGCIGIGTTYANADKYTAGDRDIDSEIDELDIDWASGTMFITGTDQKNVTVKETSDKDISDAKKVHTWVDGKTLHVRYCKSGEKVINVKKKLEIKLPKNVRLSKLGYDGASCDCTVEDIEAEDISIDTASGDIKLKDVSADSITADSASGKFEVEQSGETEKLTVDSASGDVVIKGDTIKKMHIETASGDVETKVKKTEDVYAESASGDHELRFENEPSSMTIDTASGDVNLYLPENGDYNINVDTSSGSFQSDIAFSKTGNAYSNGSGSNKYSIDTASGDITIKEYV